MSSGESVALHTEVGLGSDGRAALSAFVPLLGSPVGELAREPWFADPWAFTSHSGCRSSSPFERTSATFRWSTPCEVLAHDFAAPLSKVSRTAAITEPSESLASLKSAPAEPSVVEPTR